MKNSIIYSCLIVCLFLSGCRGCSKSGIKDTGTVTNFPKKRTSVNENTGKSKTVVKMIKVNGVYQIPVEINGYEMYFIFDTGAGLISISATEAVFLYKQGKLSESDIRGEANFSDANGNITEGTIIVLKTVKIGDRILSDIEASVVNNQAAPLLVGQSALEKFGKISIDYAKSEITFE